MRRRGTVLTILLILAAGAASRCADDNADKTSTGTSTGVTIAAASDLRPAFNELGKLYTRQTGAQVVFSFGSSGQLAQQIINGAPFDFFASASTDYVDDVVEAGRGDKTTKKTYAFGRIVVWSADRKYQLSDLSDSNVKKVAIANPEHAPYGEAAREALKRSNQLGAVQPKLVLGENISDTQRLAQSGNADAALIALSLAISSQGKWTLLPTTLHNPLEQVSVVLGEGAGAGGARKFSELLNGPDGRKIMSKYGFLLAGDRLDEEAAVASGGGS